MSGISLITATSDRPMAIALAARWLLAQQFSAPLDVQWLVCDDGRTPVPQATLQGAIADAAVHPHLRLQVQHVRRDPVTSVPLSFRGNLAAGLCRAQHDRLAIWEDDDYYPPGWLAWVTEQFDAGGELIGEERARYYNLDNRYYRQLINTGRASLCQTAFTRAGAKWLENRCRTGGGTMLDIDLWREFEGRRVLRPHSTVIGIKGMPGKSGIGMGHRLRRGSRDRDGSVLRRWVGDEAAAVYMSLFHSGEVSRRRSA